ncbi:MAG: inner membrane protein YpjD [Acidobacteriota bacterium]
MADWSRVFIDAAVALYCLGVAVSVTMLVTKRRDRLYLIPAVTVAGFVVHFIGIVLRGWHEGALPLQNMRGILFLLAWAAISVYLIAHFRFRVELLGTVILSLVVILMVVTLLIPSDPEGAQSDAESYGSIRTAGIAIHVLPGIIGVSALFLTFAASLVYLAQDRALKAHRPLRFFVRLPSLEQCERLAHQSLTWGFALLTFSVVTGVVSAIFRPDGKWHWVLREKWSILAWLILAVVIYDRIFTGGWRGRKAAYLSILGFAVIILRMVGM